MQSASETEQREFLHGGLNSHSQPTTLLKNSPDFKAINLPASLHVTDVPIVSVLDQQDANARQASRSPQEPQEQSTVEHARDNSEVAFQTVVPDSKLKTESECDSLQRRPFYNEPKAGTMRSRSRWRESVYQHQQQQARFSPASQSRSPSRNRNRSQSEEDRDLRMHAGSRNRDWPPFYGSRKSNFSSHYGAYNEHDYGTFDERYHGMLQRPPRIHEPYFAHRARMPYGAYSMPRFSIPHPSPIIMQQHGDFGRAHLKAPNMHHKHRYGVSFAAHQSNLATSQSQYGRVPNNSFPSPVPNFAGTPGSNGRSRQHAMFTNFVGSSLKEPDTAVLGGFFHPLGVFDSSSLTQPIVHQAPNQSALLPPPPPPPPPPHAPNVLPMHIHLQTSEQLPVQGNSAASQQLLTSQHSDSATDGLQIRSTAGQVQSDVEVAALSDMQDSGTQRFAAPPPPPPPPPSCTNSQLKQRSGSSESTMNQFLANLAMQAGLTNETLATYIERQKANSERSSASKDDTRSLDMDLDDAPQEVDAVLGPSDEAFRSAKLNQEREQLHDREEERKLDFKSELKSDRRWKTENGRAEQQNPAKVMHGQPRERGKNELDDKLDLLNLSVVLPERNENKKPAASNCTVEHLHSDREDHTKARSMKHGKSRDTETHRKHFRRSKTDNNHRESRAKKRIEARKASTERVHRLSFKELLSNEVRENLKSYYSKKKITKDEFKQLMDKCINKIFEASNSGRVNEKKVKKFVDSYVVKIVRSRKLSTKK